ncbi:hypothetical protein [Polyangium sp. 6x1]|uniref:hypothetical protein n=1 Tax=Polyangium sp. 6x1 TaxID=3042689 RepID=UPI002482D4EA|nr:hypothetical protein [Polyangium sp. 6x1]MDI1450787.1 hypothetical protein [Polyangium sp. 6x1]
MLSRLADDRRFVWTVFPGVDLVAYQAPGMVAIFYMLRPCDLPIRTWHATELAAKRGATGLALTVEQA